MVYENVEALYLSVFLYKDRYLGLILRLDEHCLEKMLQSKVDFIKNMFESYF